MASPVNKARTITPKELVNAYTEHGSLKKAWKSFPGTGWHYILSVYKTAVAEGLMPPIRVGAKSVEEIKDPKKILEAPSGRVRALRTKTAKTPKKGTVKRYLFTCAQNNTLPFMPFWNNLLVLADHYEAEIHVARYVYLTNSTSSVYDKFKAFEKLDGVEREREPINWDSTFSEFFSDDRLEVAPGLVWCGEMNILPTAERPLSGLEVYTGRKSGIFPHAKLAMESIPSSKHAPTKFNFTTGTVTMRNYIQRKAGLKAEFHHCYGALLVEVDSDGDWFCRQINADSEGVIHDLNIKVANEEVIKNVNVEAITWGDIHVAQMEDWVKELCWGKGGMLDTLKPKWQFFHDVLDFRAKSHHEIKHPHRMFRRYLLGETDVRAECQSMCDFLSMASRPFSENVIVDSNHHDHLGRWLEEQDGRFDPKNAEFWTAIQARVWKTLRDGSENPNYLGLVMDEVAPKLKKRFRVLERDEELIICPDRNGGIECGVHGHSGPDGSRGNVKVFSKLGRKANLGHYHKATIHDGIYTSGTCGKLDPDWTTGPSSWSHSHIITYPNGKRAIVTMWKGKWFAA